MAVRKGIKDMPKSSGGKTNVVTNLVNRSVTGRPPKDGEKKKSVSITILPSLLDEVKELAYVNRTTVSGLVETLLKDYVKKHKDK